MAAIGKKKCLILCYREPNLNGKGDQILTYKRIQYLKKTYKVSIITFSKNVNYIDPDLNYHRFNLPKLNYFKSALKFLLGKAIQSTLFDSQEIRKFLKNNSNNFDLIIFITQRMAHFKTKNNTRSIIEFIDSQALNSNRRSKIEKNLLLKVFFFFESKFLIRYEKKLVKKFDKSIIISKVDKSFINDKELIVVPAGIELKSFKIKKNKKKSIVFSGNLSYFPNYSACLWFYNNCFVNLKKKYNDLEFLIVGRNPHSSLKNISNRSGVSLFENVDSVQDLINQKAMLSVAPLFAGSGMQLKILEAFNSLVPVITTSIGNIPISAIDNKEILIANSANEFIEKVCLIIENNNFAKDLALNAKLFLKNNYSDEKVNELINEIY